MATIEQRALDAVKRLALTRTEVERLTKAIGEELGKCPGVNGGLVFVSEPGRAPYQKDPGDLTHLKVAYEPVESAFPYRKSDYMDADELVDYLGEACPHCLKAHELVQQRRAARRRHGRAKSAITKLGRELTKGDA